jgi:GNAT superfamily N-acetyltransferase
MNLQVEPLTPGRWPDLEAVFRARGCSVARGCWCMYYRQRGAASTGGGAGAAEARRQGLKALVDAGRFTGLIGYRDGQPVGWISFGPREDFAKLANSPVMKPVDAQPVWSIVCFVVPAAFRRQGVARALLQGAVAWSAAHGVQLLEAYPVDKAGPSDDQSLWFGSKSMFDAAGFDEVARRRPQRPVVRLRPV